MRNRQTGFTLIELVIVIVILGILAATALPKFIDITDDAHQAAVAGTGGGFASSLSLSHALWLARGEPDGSTTPVTMEGTDVYMTTSGWPENTSGGGDDALTEAECVEIWNGIMQNPPSVATGAGAADYDADVTGTGCTYWYQNVTPATDLEIVYDAATGTVAIDDTIDGA
ncbi:MAG: type II secretion system protein [Gammaproteobacteria bacterium]|nr:type II secretion system protein [Gammaproteobacteria bacterium]